jgi:hypothetical protein
MGLRSKPTKIANRWRVWSFTGLSLLAILSIPGIPIKAEIPLLARGAGGTGKAQVREQAIRAIPFRNLDPAAVQRVSAIVQHPTMYRRMPPRTMECSRELFLHLVRNPDTLVAIWETLGMTRLKVQRTGEFSFQADDGAGTVTNLDMLYGTPNLHLFIGTGWYDGPLFPGRLNGSGVMVMHTQYRAAPNGTELVDCTMDAFMQIDQGAVDLAAKTLHPLFVKNADVNFIETADFISSFSQATTTNPSAIMSLARRVRGIDEANRTELISILEKKSPRAAHGARPR